MYGRLDFSKDCCQNPLVRLIDEKDWESRKPISSTQSRTSPIVYLSGTEAELSWQKPKTALMPLQAALGTKNMGELEQERLTF